MLTFSRADCGKSNEKKKKKKKREAVNRQCRRAENVIVEWQRAQENLTILQDAAERSDLLSIQPGREPEQSKEPLRSKDAGVLTRGNETTLAVIEATAAAAGGSESDKRTLVLKNTTDWLEKLIHEWTVPPSPEPLESVNETGLSESEDIARAQSKSSVNAETIDDRGKAKDEVSTDEWTDSGKDKVSVEVLDPGQRERVRKARSSSTPLSRVISDEHWKKTRSPGEDKAGLSTAKKEVDQIKRHDTAPRERSPSYREREARRARRRELRQSSKLKVQQVDDGDQSNVPNVASEKLSLENEQENQSNIDSELSTRLSVPASSEHWDKREDEDMLKAEKDDGRHRRRSQYTDVLSRSPLRSKKGSILSQAKGLFTKSDSIPVPSPRLPIIEAWLEEQPDPFLDGEEQSVPVPAPAPSPPPPLDTRSRRNEIDTKPMELQEHRRYRWQLEQERDLLRSKQPAMGSSETSKSSEATPRTFHFSTDPSTGSSTGFSFADPSDKFASFVKAGSALGEDAYGARGKRAEVNPKGNAIPNQGADLKHAETHDSGYGESGDKPKPELPREVAKEKAREKEAHASNAKSRDREQRSERMDKQSSRRPYVEDDYSSDSDTATYVSINRPPPRTSKSAYDSVPRTKPKPELPRRNTSRREEDEDEEEDKWHDIRGSAREYIERSQGPDVSGRTSSRRSYRESPDDRQSGRKSGSDSDKRPLTSKRRRPSIDVLNARPPAMPSHNSAPAGVATMKAQLEKDGPRSQTMPSSKPRKGDAMPVRSSNLLFWST